MILILNKIYILIERKKENKKYALLRYYICSVLDALTIALSL